MRTLAFGALVIGLAACFPDPLEPLPGTSGGAGGSTGGGAGRGGATGGTSGSGTGGGNSGAAGSGAGIAGAGGGGGVAGATGGSSGASAGSSGATAGIGGGVAGAGGASGASAGASGASAGSSGSTAGSSGATGGSSGANAGSAGASAGASGASAGSSGANAGSSGASAGGAGASGEAGASGAGGAAGATVSRPTYTMPGQLDCFGAWELQNKRLCTNFSPAIGNWEEFTPCNTRPVEGGNTIWRWSASASGKCSVSLTAGAIATDDDLELGMWVRIEALGLGETEPAMPILRLTRGTLEGALALRLTRDGLGNVTGIILVLLTEGKPYDVASMALGQWRHVRVGIRLPNVVTASIGADSTSIIQEISQPTAGATGAAKVSFDFKQEQFLAGNTAISVDDLTLTKR